MICKWMDLFWSFNINCVALRVFNRHTSDKENSESNVDFHDFCRTDLITKTKIV